MRKLAKDDVDEDVEEDVEEDVDVDGEKGSLLGLSSNVLASLWMLRGPFLRSSMVFFSATDWIVPTRRERDLPDPQGESTMRHLGASSDAMHLLMAEINSSCVWYNLNGVQAPLVPAVDEVPSGNHSPPSSPSLPPPPSVLS